MNANETVPGWLDAALRDVLRAVDQSAQLSLRIQQHTPRRHQKRDATPLTVADLAVQAVVAHALERAFPGEPLIAEEDASALSGDAGPELIEQTLQFVRSLLPALTRAELERLLNTGAGSPAERFWTLDPIDGTEGFLRGGHYVVSLALIEDYRPTVAILGCPTLDCAGWVGHARGLVMVARRECGTWASPMGTAEFEPVRVSDIRSLHDARILRSFAESHINADLTRELTRAAGIEHPPILMDSQAKHVTIAAGHADLLVRIPSRVDYREYIWDHAAGALAIEEAGGRLTDLDGHSLDFHTGRRFQRNRGIVAANQHLHPLALDVIRACGAYD